MSKSADAFRTISEVAEWLDTPAHVLRFWESKFSQVKPVKRAGGRRYYRPQDMMLLGGIKKLLHDDGMTIKHVQKLLRQEGVKYVSGLSSNPSDGSIYAPMEDAPAPDPQPETSQVLSFRSEPAPAPEPKRAPETKAMPAADPAPSPASSPAPGPTPGSLSPVPSFLSGGRDMPQPEPAADAAPAPKDPAPVDPAPVDPASADPAPAPLPPIEEPPAPTPHVNVFTHMGGRSSDDIRAHEAALRPLMDRIRAQLDRMA
ncbi:MAG: MerR family transcriptional regulator [Pseudomonadota bacterium]